MTTEERREEQRFLSMVTIAPSGCWLWAGHILNGGNGYGQFRSNKGLVVAHRWSYERYRGALLPRRHVHHVCRVRRCVNPEHLEQLTTREHGLTMRGLVRKSRPLKPPEERLAAVPIMILPQEIEEIHRMFPEKKPRTEWLREGLRRLIREEAARLGLKDDAP